MKVPSDFLFQFISRLSKKDQAYLRRYLKSGKKNSSQLIELFDAIAGQKKNKEDKIIQKLNIDKNVLSKLKYELKGILLEGMRRRMLDSGANKQMKTRQEHDFLSIVITMELFDEAKIQIDKLKDQAELEGNPFNNWVALSAESVVAQKIYDLKLGDALHRISDEIGNNMKDIALLGNIYKFYLKAMAYTCTDNLIRSKQKFDEINSLKKWPEFKLKNDGLTFYQQFHLNEARAHVFELTNNKESYFKTQQEVWNSFHAQKKLWLRQNPEYYFNAQSNFLEACLLTARVEIARKCLNEFKSLLDKGQFKTIVNRANYYHHSLIMERMTKKKVGQSLLQASMEFYTCHKEELMVQQALNLAFDFMVISLKENELKDVRKFCEEILRLPRTNQSQKGLQEYAELLRLVINYEEDELPALKINLEQYKRRILKQPKLYPLELAVVKAFSLICKNSDRKMEILADLKKGIKDLRKNPNIHYVEKLFDNFDLEKWIGEKLKR